MLFVKNFQPNKKPNHYFHNSNDRIEYKKTIFKGIFYKHYSHSQWFYRILKPEEDKEVIKELRNRKLKEIENGSK